jgi:hypothetical protein
METHEHTHTHTHTHTRTNAHTGRLVSDQHMEAVAGTEAAYEIRIEVRESGENSGDESNCVLCISGALFWRIRTFLIP